MKLKLNKKKIKSLSNDNKAIPAEMTPQVAGGLKNEYTYDCRLTLFPRYTCGIGYTCANVY